MITNLMANTEHEDAIMKMGFGYFRDTILKTLGIDYEFVEPGETELVELTIHSLYMDFTFLTKDGFYIHIEFQTTDSKVIADLRRFRAYEVVYSNKTGRNVITYVIYSGGITKTKTELDCGTHIYRVIPIYLKDKDADTVFRRLKEKREKGESFAEEDFADISLTPLMSGSFSKKDAIKEGILLTKQFKTITAEKTTAMLYALADKFLTGDELVEIKEVLRMTRLGQMLVEEGREEGRQEGREEGHEESRTEIIFNMLSKNQFSFEEIAELVGVSVEKVEEIQRCLKNER